MSSGSRSHRVLIVFLFLLCISNAKKNEFEVNSATYHDIPGGEGNGIKQFFWKLDKERVALKASDEAREEHPSLRQEAVPNQPVPKIADYVEVVPQLPVSKSFLEKEMYIDNDDCRKATHFPSFLIYISPPCVNSQIG